MSKTETKKQELREVTAQFKELERQLDELREKAGPLVVSLLKAGEPPTEVADLSPFSTAWVRNLARANGIPPASRGRRRRDE